MPDFRTVQMPVPPDPAPDGSLTYPLVRTERASVGVIELRPRQVTAPVRHRSIEEVWYVLEGTGEIWRRLEDQEETVELRPGTCLTIPTGCAFQFRSTTDGPFRMLMLTVPPWPGPDEAEVAEGPWHPAPGI